MALADNLVSYWSLNEASGSRADSHGTQTLTDVNTVTSGTGKIGNAANFERDDSEYLSHADSADLSLGSDTAFYIACWINLETAVGAGIIVNKGVVTGAGDEYLLWIGDLGGGLSPRLELYVGNGSSSANALATTFGAPSLGTWYFVEAWHNPATNQIGVAVNGVENTASWSGGTQDTANAFAVGSKSGGGANYFDGLIDELGFWKGRVLDAGERADLYNSGNGRDYAYISAAAAGQPAVKRMGGVMFAANPWRHCQGVRGW